MSEIILSTAYLGNIQYYTKLLGNESVIDLHENFQKQSFRNRCMICTPTGIDTLIIPVYQPSGIKVKTCDIRIDNSKKWQHRHRNAIISAYRSSPYFSYYEDEFTPFFTQRYDLLIDFNKEIQNKVLQLLGCSPSIKYSEEYITETTEQQDFRMSLSPKERLSRPDPHFVAQPYYQVFSEKVPFMENLCILDLLCCEGPAAIDLLRASIR